MEVVLGVLLTLSIQHPGMMLASAVIESAQRKGRALEVKGDVHNHGRM